MSDASDRTIPATPRRRELARRQGMMPMAALPAWVATVATVILLLPAWAQATLPAATSMMRQSLATLTDPAAPRLDLLLPAALLLPTVALVAVAGTVCVTVRFLLDGSAWQLSRAAPSLHRVSPLVGFGRIFSAATLWAVTGHAAGLAVLVTAAGLAAGPVIATLGVGGMEEPARLFAAAQRSLLPLVVAAAAVAAVTWGVGRLRFERRIRMTPEEYADEARSMQADPKVRLMQRQQPRPQGTA